MQSKRSSVELRSRRLGIVPDEQKDGRAALLGGASEGARLRGEDFDDFEVVDIAFDEEFAEGTFRLELPGAEFGRVDF